MQHAFLRANYLIPNNLSIVRLGSKASCKNPVIALPSKIHKKVNKLQKEMVPLKGVTGRQHIEANIKVLRKVNLPEKQIRKLAKKAVKHAIDLGIF